MNRKSYHFQQDILMTELKEATVSRQNKSQLEVPVGQFADAENADKRDMPINIQTSSSQQFRPQSIKTPQSPAHASSLVRPESNIKPRKRRVITSKGARPSSVYIDDNYRRYNELAR